MDNRGRKITAFADSLHVRAFNKRNGLTVAMLAKRLGLKNRTLEKWLYETGVPKTTQRILYLALRYIEFQSRANDRQNKRKLGSGVPKGRKTPRTRAIGMMVARMDEGF